MILHSLTLRNFRLHAESTIEFDIGLTGLIGSNGEGKSSMLEGLGWCFFGAKAIRGEVRGIRWHGAPAMKVAEAESVFSVGGLKYRLWRSETNARLYVDGRERPIAESTSGVNERIPELLGMDLSQFEATFLCRQKELAAISTMKGAARRTFFLGVMGIQKIVDAQDELRKQRSAAKSERDGMALGLGEREPLAAEVEAAHAASESAEAGYRQALDVEREADVAVTAAAQLAEESGRLATRHTELTVARAAAVGDAERSGLEVARLEKRLAEILMPALSRSDEVSQRLAKLPDLRAERDRMREALVIERRRREIVADREKLTTRAHDARNAAQQALVVQDAYDSDLHASVQDRISDIKNQRESLALARRDSCAAAKSQLADATKRIGVSERKIRAIEEAGEGGACPTCLRALEEAFGAVVATLTEELSTLRQIEAQAVLTVGTTEIESRAELDLSAEVRSLEAENERLEHQRQRAQLAKGTYDLRMDEAERAEADLAGLSAKLAELPTAAPPVPAEATYTDLVAQVNALEAAERDQKLAEDRRLAGQIPEAHAEIARHRAAAENAGRLVASLDDDLTELSLDFDPAVHANVVREAEAARTRHADAQLALARSQADATAAKGRWDRARSALAEYDTRAEALRSASRRVADYERADQRMSEFRAAQVSAIRPEMEELMSGLIGALTDGRFESCSVNEDFEVVLQRNGLDESVISGGEEDIVALAQRIVTSQMISERAGHPLSLLILDEPFGSLDAGRLQNVLGMIRRLERVFPQVLLISHLDEVKESVDHAILVKLDPETGRSHVRPIASALQEVA